jgi:hypothetical protein
MEITSMNGIIPNIENRIFTIRGLQVMLDSDLAVLYGVETKRLNEQVRRNAGRFPGTFRFQLTTKEMNELVAKCDRLKRLKHSSVNSFVFSEHGVAMLSAILRSQVAVEMSIMIIETFIKLRRIVTHETPVIQRVEQLELFQHVSNEKFQQIFKALETRNALPDTGIFFEGEVFDSSAFVSDLVGSAKHSILLIDNYVDDTVLKLLAKRAEGVTVTIYTRKLTPQFTLEADKFNKQHRGLTLQELTTSHDRFLIIDDTVLYHIGASLKDLGKKWFAFSKIDSLAPQVLQKLR